MIKLCTPQLSTFDMPSETLQTAYLQHTAKKKTFPTQTKSLPNQPPVKPKQHHTPKITVIDRAAPSSDITRKRDKFIRPLEFLPPAHIFSCNQTLTS